MRTIRTICLISVAIVCLLAGARSGAAKPCDEVLYVALGGTGLNEPTFIEGWSNETKYSIDKTLRLPHYLGIVCVDNMRKKLKFFPKDDNSPFNREVETIVTRMNSPYAPLSWPSVTLRVNARYEKLGEGRTGLILFVPPKDTALFPYWAGEALRDHAIRVIRREVNAEPDLAWTPKFKQTIPFGEYSSRPPMSFDWINTLCDEVFYMALDGTGAYDFSRHTVIKMEETIFPHYMGALCVDNINKKLEFFPHDKDYYLNWKVELVVEDMNEKWGQDVLVRVKERHRELGGGPIWGNFLAVPKDTALFPYWTSEALESYGVQVFRRETNAEPDLDWMPQFKHALPFYEHHTAPDMSYR